MGYKIPLFDLNDGADEIAAFKQCVNDNWISIGPKCAKFEETFAKMLGAKHAVSCDNCTNALFMAMLALGIKKGDEVVFSVPVNVGIVGGIIGIAAAPWALIAGSVAAFGLGCRLEVVKKDGTTDEVK